MYYAHGVVGPAILPVFQKGPSRNFPLLGEGLPYGQESKEIDCFSFYEIFVSQIYG